MNVHVSTVPYAQQSHSETKCNPGSRSDTDSSLLTNTAVVTPLQLCVDHPVLAIPPRSTVTTGTEIHLGRKVVPSPRMESLMQHYKAAGFSDEVSILAAAPRRPSTNRTYDDRWLRFTLF